MFTFNECNFKRKKNIFRPNSLNNSVLLIFGDCFSTLLFSFHLKIEKWSRFCVFSFLLYLFTNINSWKQCCGFGSGIRCLAPWIRDPEWVKNQDPDPGWILLDHISESLETIFWAKILQFCDADADPGIFLTPDPGSGMGKIRIRDKHPGSATLPASQKFWRPHQVKGRVSQDFKATEIY